MAERAEQSYSSRQRRVEVTERGDKFVVAKRV